MTNFEQFERYIMQQIAKPGALILVVGVGGRFQKGMKQFESLFVACDYKTLDVSADYNPDVVGDIHAIPLPDASVDAIICRSVLEHVERPWDACKEMHRILKPGGQVFIQVPSVYPYHARTGHGAYPDYWRFFESSLRLMLQHFSQVTVVKHGGWFRLMFFFMPGQARLRPLLDPVISAFDRWFKTERRSNTAFFSVLAKK